MSFASHPSRRQVTIGTAASVTTLGLGLTIGASTALAATLDDWKRLVELTAEAKKLGLNVPQISTPATRDARFEEIVRAVVDFIDHLDAVKTEGELAKSVAGLRARATALLNDINAKERHPRSQGTLENPHRTWLGLLLGAPAMAADTTDAKYEKYRQGYIDLFESCVVRPDKQDSVNWYVDKLASDKYRSAYEKLEEVVCVPWYFIGVIHALETSFNFEAHLHNGDPLSRKTTHVPAGRPVPWLPPSDWQSSAKDSLEFEHYTNHTDWNLAKLLFRLEGYNGFRSREQHGINSPYLWSFSNHYTSGKFVADNVWSSTAVSQQCGAAVMIKELVNRKLVVPVA